LNKIGIGLAPHKEIGREKWHSLLEVTEA
jgi:hypothetical protein